MAKEYEKLIQKRLNKEFTLILRVAMVIAFLCGTMLLLAEIPLIYAVANYITALILLGFSIYPTRIKTFYKIILLAVITIIIAIISFVGGGFTSAFITLLILSNVITVLFLRRKMGLLMSASTVLLMIAMAAYAGFTSTVIDMEAYFLTWGLQILAYVLALVVLHQSIYTVKRYLFENIERLEASVTEINQLAYYDKLTGLPNDHKFKMDIQERVDFSENNGFILIINFPSIRLINSTLGYEAGNQTIIEIGNVLLREKKENEIISRIGGNEFAIWLENVDEEECRNRADLIMIKLRRQGYLMQKKLEFYAAYSYLRQGYKSFEDCYREVTLTLAHVKNLQDPRLTAYCDDMEAEIRRKEKIKDLIGDAMKANEITLYYQAKCDARTGNVVGVEALARWKSPELGMVSPGEFIPIIELVNMSREFGDFVIFRACSDFQNLQNKYNENIKVSINISPTHIKDPTIIDSMKRAMDQYHIPPNRMVVEITEDLLIDGIDAVKDVILDLKDLHVDISLDDFGTGYSSLNYLAQLDFDEIKIDKTFVDQIDSSERANILLNNIIQLSKQFDLSVIAEGVETKEQCDMLKKLGCFIIQGYYFSKPENLY